jgi:eukaryotic-like serine/threonine-protein kinase
MGGSAVHGGPPSRTTAVGDIVGGFTLVRQLGSGGMGETWEAIRRVGQDFEQRVAVKLGSPDLLRHAEGRELLRREASLAASLRHPNIAAVLDWSEERGYIICELVEGADLRAVLREAPQGRLPPALLVHVIWQIARGLSHAHRRLLHGQPSPVIHRDMSPGNIVVDYDGALKIVDFGIAKAVGSADWSQSIKGKLAYMAPEQATGESMDGRVDQYALGVIAYEAATSVRPNDGAHDGETLARILEGNHIPVGKRAPSIPAGLGEIIERMLAVAPDERFPNMDAVIDALEPLTPPLTIHRSLAALVHKAHPPHTIVQESGKFVSRPVSFGLPSRELRTQSAMIGGQTPSRVRSLTPIDRPPSTPSISPFHQTEGYGHAPLRELDVPPSLLAAGTQVERDKPAHTAHARLRTLAVGAVVALGFAVVTWAVFSPAQTPRPPPTISAEPAEQSGRPAHATLAPGTTLPSGQVASQPAASGVTPAAQVPAAPSVLADEPSVTAAPVPATEAAAASNAGPQRSSSKRGGTWRRRAAGAARASGAVSEIDRDDARQASTGQATVRVKVFPWGRVWIDGKVRGSVPPILEAQVNAGTHTIAVGQEAPTESRILTVAPGDNQLLSFDLEGW